MSLMGELRELGLKETSNAISVTTLDGLESSVPKNYVELQQSIDGIR